MQRFLASAFALAFVAACAPVGTRPDRLEVSSEPDGAEVYVMGAKHGVTPVSIPLATIFPSTYPPEQQSRYGTVELRRQGCASAIRPVSTAAVARGLRVDLDCGPIPPEAGVQAGQPVPATRRAAEQPDAEQRLRQIRDWLDQGLITDDEAREARRRILDAL